MAKCKTVKLNHAEIEYLLALALSNRESGEYWGRKDYFLARQEKVISKLLVAAHTKAPE